MSAWSRGSRPQFRCTVASSTTPTPKRASPPPPSFSASPLLHRQAERGGPMRPSHPPAPAAPRRVPFPAGLYLILDPAVAGLRLHPPAPDVPSRVSFPALAELVTTALTTGVRLFQLRMKTPHAGEFYDLAAQSCALVRAGRGTFLVKDRVAVGEGVGTGWVPVGKDELPLDGV